MCAGREREVMFSRRSGWLTGPESRQRMQSHYNTLKRVKEGGRAGGCVSVDEDEQIHCRTPSTVRM